MYTVQERTGRLVAILRGIHPHEAVAVGQVLVDAGFRAIEVPLNSPNAFSSIALLAKTFGQDTLIGAGTVLQPSEVDRVKAAGGKLIVSPNTNPDVIRRSKAEGLVALPGFATATEAFAAIDAGADGLKMFPAGAGGAATLGALKSVLPVDIPVYAVGGVGPANMTEFAHAGADGFGLGSNLYRPGDTSDAVAQKAQEAIAACAKAYETL